MRCAQCNTQNAGDARFCEECGAPIEQRCSACGHASAAGAKYCKTCGQRFGSAAEPLRPGGGMAQGAGIGVTAAVAAHEVPDGERKTVTALFADIKGSMELQENLDPEEARRIVDPALQLMMDAVHRYDGYVAQSTGDGIFALFGAPVAHEDHPQRALYAALRMQEELKRYSDTLRTRGQAPISIRVGVNTGEVVVRTLQTDATHTEYVPIGHSTSLAARLQALAAPGSIAISEAVRKFVEGYFTLKALGPAQIKGVSEPVNVYEVTGLGLLRTRLQRAVGRGLTKFVGRQAELEALKHAAELAKAGHGQLAAIVGEPGVGKSRLVYEFKAVTQSGCLVLETFSVSHGKASAYLPVIELLHGYFEIRPEDDARKRREKVAGKIVMLDRSLEDTLPYLFAVLGLVEGYDPLASVEGQLRRRRTLEAIKRLVLRESVHQPLVLICEDLHWIDSETQALLNLLADSLGTAKVLLLVNYRPEYTHGWGNKTYYTQVRLDPLGRESAEEMLATLLGNTPELGPLKRRIAEQTEGNPFFIEEIVQSLFEEGVLVRDGTVRLTKPVGALTLPSTVQGMLAARIDRLPPEQKELLQTLAVLGKEFAFDLVRAVTGRGDDDLTRLLNELQLAEFIYEQPAAGEVEYTFKHALTQEVAYHSVLSERRKVLHERAGAAIEAVGAGWVEDHLPELAHHYSRSTNVGKAVEYLGRAGQRAAQQAAYGEAESYLTRALDLLRQLPENAARDRQELELRQSLLEMLWITNGFGAPEAIVAHERVAVLAERSGTLAQLVDSALLRCSIAFSSGDVTAASALATQALDLAAREGDPTRLAAAHTCALLTDFYRGDLTAMEERFTNGRAFFDDAGFRQLPTGTALTPFAFASQGAWYLGRPEVARERMAQGMAVVDPNHPYGEAYAAVWAGGLPHWFGEYARAEALEAQALARAETGGFPFIAAVARLFLGYARAQLGHAAEGVALARQGVADLVATGSRTELPHHLGMLAEVQACAGDVTGALATVNEALEINPDVRVSRPDNLKIRGTLRLALGQPDLAEVDFREAIALAQLMGAKMLELRATIRLARLLADQGHRDEARTMLAEIYGWFTEGFDTVDLKEAKALLEELGG